MIDGEAVALILRMVVSLAVVLGLIVLFARYLERRGAAGGARGRSRRRRARTPRPEVDLDVLARTHLSKGASVHVVRIGRQMLAVGVTDASVTVLTDLGPADLVVDDDIEDDVAPGAVVRPTDSARAHFEHLLRREGRHRGAPPAHPTGSQTDV